MKPEISVIIPFYKATNLQLRICLESVVQQSFTNFEVLVIDDGAPDHHDDLKEEFEKRDSRIRFYRQKNAGVSTARNWGLNLAKGDYITFLDSDDFWDSGFLYKMHSAIDGYDIVICGVDEQWFPSIHSCVDHKIYFSTPSQYNFLQYSNFSVNKLYRTEIIKKYGDSFPVDVKLGEDALFVASYLSHCKKIRCIPDRLYHYVPNVKSSVHTFNKNYWKFEQRVIKTQWEMFHQYPLCEFEEAFMQHWLFDKMKSILFYYLPREYKRKADKINRPSIQEILASELFAPILSQPIITPNRFFSEKELDEIEGFRKNSVRTAYKMYKDSIHVSLIHRLRRFLSRWI